MTPRVCVVNSKHLSQDNVGCESTENRQGSISPLLLPSHNPLNWWQRSGQLTVSTRVQRAIPVASQSKGGPSCVHYLHKGTYKSLFWQHLYYGCRQTPVTQVTVIQVQTIPIKIRRLQVSNSRVGTRWLQLWLNELKWIELWHLFTRQHSKGFPHTDSHQSH